MCTVYTLETKNLQANVTTCHNTFNTRSLAHFTLHTERERERLSGREGSACIVLSQLLSVIQQYDFASSWSVVLVLDIGRDSLVGRSHGS
jgi:hypothetical protein